MNGTFYNLEEIRLKVLYQLRSQQGGMKAGPIALALGLPLWVVGSALDSALIAKLVTYEPAKGYVAVAAAPMVSAAEKVAVADVGRLAGGVA